MALPGHTIIKQEISVPSFSMDQPRVNRDWVSLRSLGIVFTRACTGPGLSGVSQASLYSTLGKAKVHAGKSSNKGCSSERRTIVVA